MKFAFILFSLLLLGACSPSETTPPPKLFKEYRAALDKTKATEALMQQTAQEQQQALELQTQ